MKTSVMDVGDMLSVLSVVGVEQRIGEVPGVESVTVDFAGAKATVRYDETRLDLSDIKSDVRQRGSDADAEPKATMPDGHEGHASPDAQKGDAAQPATSKTPPASPAKTVADKPVDSP